jgi:ribosomal protein S18 acetylase RimI-like enzyme
MTSRVVSEVEHGSPLYRECVALRLAVLRTPLGLSFTEDELQRESASLHLACHDGQNLVGCLALVPLPDGEIKMRQVAVAPETQGRGIGRSLVDASETLARHRGFTLMTLHARTTAVPFYERLGYETVGDEFEEVTVPHRAMQKRL